MNQTILNIDDNKIDNVIFEKLAKRANLNNPDIQIISNPKKAVKLLQNIAKKQPFALPNIIFVDLQMPVLNGFEVLDILQKTGIMKKSEVYLVSCCFDKRDINRTQSYPDLAGYIQKPFTLAKMASILNAKVVA